MSYLIPHSLKQKRYLKKPMDAKEKIRKIPREAKKPKAFQYGK